MCVRELAIASHGYMYIIHGLAIIMVNQTALYVIILYGIIIFTTVGKYFIK